MQGREESTNVEEPASGSRATPPVGAYTPSHAMLETVFPGRSEMAERCRAFDWSTTPLGPVDGWSQSLRTMAGAVVNSRNPMLLFWGPGLVQLYNDAFRPSLGYDGADRLGRHRAALGAEGREFWRDVWPVVGPQIESVMMRGESVWFEDQYLPIERNGRLEDVWWTYSYSPVRDDDGSIQGTLVVCLETTQRVLGERRLQRAAADLEERTTAVERALAKTAVAEEHLRDVFAQAPVGVAVLVGPTLVYEIANARFQEIIGGGRPLIGVPAREAFPEVAGQGYFELLDGVLATGTPVSLPESRVHIDRDRDGASEEYFYDLRVEALRSADGRPYAVVIIAAEVTEQVRARTAVDRARAEIAAAEQRLRDVVEQTPVSVAVMEGPEHVYTLVSPRYATYAGTRTFLGRAARDVVPEVAGQGLFELLDRVYATGEPYIEPERSLVVDRDGDGVPEAYVFDVGYLPLRDAAGAVYAIASVTSDVTERVRARQALESTQERLQLALRAGRLGAWELDVATRVLEASPSCKANFGRAPDDPLTYADLLAAIHPDDRAAARAAVAASLASGTEYDGEYRVTWPDGSQHWIAARGSVSFDATGATPARMTGVTQDVTARHLADAERERLLAAERAARAVADEARRRAELLQRLTAALSATLSAEQVASVVLERGLPAFGAGGGGVVLLETPTEDDAPAHMRVLRMVGFDAGAATRWQRYPLNTGTPGTDAVLTGAPVLLPDRAAWKDRYAAHWPFIEAQGYEAYASVPLRFEGRTIGALTVNFPGPHTFPPEDVALLAAFAEQCAQALERARLYAAAEAARQDAERARAAAEEANQAKSAFLATMSHELRTPLNAIGGYAELIELGIRGAVTAEQRADLVRIQASQRHLLGLINDVLNYAKLETGTVRYELMDVRVDDALRSAEGLVIPQMRAKELAFSVAACGPELRVRADDEKARQILVNLLSNAVKFTSRGGAITLGIDATPDVVRLFVRDTGIGIPADKLEAIFEPFVQVRGDLTRTAEGTGLGLAISRDLARGMGGDLTVESVLGAGATFTLTLPRA